MDKRNPALASLTSALLAASPRGLGVPLIPPAPKAKRHGFKPNGLRERTRRMRQATIRAVRQAQRDFAR